MLNAGKPSAQVTANCIVRLDLPMPDCPTSRSEPPRHSQRSPRTLLGSLPVSNSPRVEMRRGADNPMPSVSLSQVSKSLAPTLTPRSFCILSPRDAVGRREKRDGFLFCRSMGNSSGSAAQILSRRSWYSFSSLALMRTHAWMLLPPESINAAIGKPLARRMDSCWSFGKWSDSIRVWR